MYVIVLFQFDQKGKVLHIMQISKNIWLNALKCLILKHIIAQAFTNDTWHF